MGRTMHPMVVFVGLSPSHGTSWEVPWPYVWGYHGKYLGIRSHGRYNAWHGKFHRKKKSSHGEYNACHGNSHGKHNVHGTFLWDFQKSRGVHSGGCKPYEPPKNHTTLLQQRTSTDTATKALCRRSRWWDQASSTLEVNCVSSSPPEFMLV